MTPLFAYDRAENGTRENRSNQKINDVYGNDNIFPNARYVLKMLDSDNYSVELGDPMALSDRLVQVSLIAE